MNSETFQREKRDEKWWKKKILTMDFISKFILLERKSWIKRERIFLEIDIKKSFNYDRLISPLVIIYQL